MDDEFLLRRRRISPSLPVLGAARLVAGVLTVVLVTFVARIPSGEAAWLEGGLTPPVSSSNAEVTPGLTIFVGRTEVQLDRHTVAHVHDGRVDEATFRADFAARAAEYRDWRPTCCPPSCEASLDELKHRALVVIDQDTPYALVSLVIDAAQDADFREFQMVTRF